MIATVARFLLFLFASLVIVFSVLAYFFGVKINLTKSMPLGIYTSFNQDSNFKKGDLIFFNNNRLLKFFKYIAAAQGDHVKVTQKGVYINGEYIKNSTIYKYSSNGSALKPCYINKIIGKNEYFVMGLASNSYDSRYFCTIFKSNQIEKVKVLYVF